MRERERVREREREKERDLRKYLQGSRQKKVGFHRVRLAFPSLTKVDDLVCSSQSDPGLL